MDKFFDQDKSSTMQGLGFHIADFIIGILDRLKERRKEKEEEYNEYLNTRLNMVDQFRADLEWENNHLRQQIGYTRGELDFMVEDRDVELPSQAEVDAFLEGLNAEGTVDV